MNEELVDYIAKSNMVRNLRADAMFAAAEQLQQAPTPPKPDRLGSVEKIWFIYLKYFSFMIKITVHTRYSS